MPFEESYKIQLLRGLAIIGVIFIHSAPPGINQIWIRPLLNCSVAIFLFISGFLSSQKKWKPIKRIKKVLIPYLLWSLIYELLRPFTSIKSFLVSLVYNTVTGSSAAIMYYIFVYIQLTLLIPLLDKLSKSKFKYLGLLVSPLEIILMRLAPLLTGIIINPYLAIIIRLSCLGWFSYFYLGYIIGNKELLITIDNAKLAIITILGIIWQIIEGYMYFSLGSMDSGTQLKISSVFTNIFLLLLAYKFIKSEKQLRNNLIYLIGNNSFGIYFSHLAIMSILSRIPLYSDLVFPINGLVTLGLSLGFILIVKNILGNYAKYLSF